VQGYQMAKNLQAKLSPQDSVHLFDINTSATQKLANEVSSAQVGGAVVHIEHSAINASRHAVCSIASCKVFGHVMMIQQFPILL
jgi:3-hydroxyisobutyrate/3-hydroxypropionate dehydrogenase